MAWGVSVRRSPILLLAFGTFWIWKLFCDAMGQTPGASLGMTFIDFLYYASWMIIGAVLFADDGVRKRLPYVIAVCGLIATLFGLIELTTRQSLSAYFGFLRFAAGDQSHLSNIDENNFRGLDMRVKSLFSHPIIYGQMLAAMMPIAIHLVLRARNTGKVLGIALAAGILVSMVLSNARSPALVLIVGCGTYLALYLFDRKKASRLFVALFASLLLLLAAPAITLQLLDIASGQTSGEALSSTGRAQQVHLGTAALEASPIIGFGTGSVGPIAGIRGRHGIVTVDDYYLSLAVDSGYVGAAFFVFMLLCATLKGVVVTNADPRSDERSLNAAYTSMIAGLGVGLFVISITDTLSVIYLMMGYLIAQTGTNVPISRLARPISRRPAPR